MKSAAIRLAILIVCVPYAVEVQGACRVCESSGGCGECLMAADDFTGALNCYVENGNCHLEPPYCTLAAGCFLGNVPVATPSGNVPIRDLDVGALVLSMDQGGNPVSASVVSKEVYETWSYLNINDRLQVTDTHPFFVGGKWVSAGDLSIGDNLVLLGGRVEPIVSIERVNKGVRVYSISVLETETFFAGATYVHNKPPIFGE